MAACDHWALLIGESSQGCSHLAGRLEKSGYKCSFVASQEEARTLLSIQPFDLVLSPLRVRGESFSPLIDLLDGSHTTLYFFQAVEEGCWWLPALQYGQRCFGTNALRPSEFIAVLDKVRDGAPACVPALSEETSSFFADELEHDDYVGDRSLRLLLADGYSSSDT